MKFLRMEKSLQRGCALCTESSVSRLVINGDYKWSQRKGRKGLIVSKLILQYSTIQRCLRVLEG